MMLFLLCYPREENLYLCDTNHTEGGQEELESVLFYGSGTAGVPDPGTPRVQTPQITSSSKTVSVYGEPRT